MNLEMELLDKVPLFYDIIKKFKEKKNSQTILVLQRLFMHLPTPSMNE